MSTVEARQGIAVVKLKACPRLGGLGGGAVRAALARRPRRPPDLPKVTTNLHTERMAKTARLLAIETIALQINSLRGLLFIPVGNHGEINQGS